MLWVFVLAALAALGLWLAHRFGVRFPGVEAPKVVTGFRRRARGIIFGKSSPYTVKYSPTKAEGHVAVWGGSGTGKTSAVLIPTLSAWDGHIFCIDIAGDISSNVDMPAKLEYRPDDPDSIPFNVFGTIDQCEEDSERWERLERLAFLILPDKPGGDGDGAAEFFRVEARKMLTAALICHHENGFDFIEICEKIVGASWRDFLNEIASQGNEKANQFIRSFSGASEKNNAGCKQALDTAVKLFATNENIKKTIRRPMDGEAFFAPRVLESNSVFVVVSDAKLALYAPLLQIITAQVLDYFSERPPKKTTKILIPSCREP